MDTSYVCPRVTLDSGMSIKICKKILSNMGVWGVVISSKQHSNFKDLSAKLVVKKSFRKNKSMKTKTTSDNFKHLDLN